MTAPKNPNEPVVVPVREYVKTADEPVEVAGQTVKASEVNAALAKEARAARKRGRKAS